MNFRLQRFWNVCASCGLRFETLLQRGDYEPVIYDNGRESRRYLDADQDPVWQEVETFIADEHLPPRHELEEAYLFHAVLARTVDPPPDGVAFGNPWDDVPCSGCGSRKRKTFGRVTPNAFADVAIDPVSHARWNSLTSDQKSAVVRGVIAAVDAAKRHGP